MLMLCLVLFVVVTRELDEDHKVRGDGANYLECFII